MVSDKREQNAGCRIGVVQMVSTGDIDANLAQADTLLEQAAAGGARIVVFPENFAVLATRQMQEQGQTEAGTEPRIRQWLSERARDHNLWIVGGSLPLATRPDGSAIDDRVRATCLVYDNEGREVARYDKIHLFDAQVDDAHGSYRESDTFEPGEDIVTIDTPAGKLGLAICYDLRFPELFRKLREQGAEWITLPSAFTYQTGEAHWHPLVRARAIENQLWLAAPGQGGWNSSRRRTWGHSMIVDPWGTVVDELPEGPGVVFADLDRDKLRHVRESMPVWSHRRL